MAKALAAKLKNANMSLRTMDWQNQLLHHCLLSIFLKVTIVLVVIALLEYKSILNIDALGLQA